MSDLMMTENYREWRHEGEQGAVWAMKHGDLRPMLDLLHPIDMREVGIDINEVNPEIKNLSPETWALFVQMVRRKLGYTKGKVGRPKGRRESPDAKRAKTATQNANDLVPVIIEILRTDYPKQKRYIKRRALELAERIGKVKPAEGGPGGKLARYRQRKRSDRRRP
jgi:hypothetical protein